jgi:hypothetical protein
MSSKKLTIGCTLVAIRLVGCAATNQVNADLQYQQLRDGNILLGRDGIGVLTPSAPTGQEADRHALADALGAILEENTQTKVVTLPAMLSAINESGLARSYSTMFTEYERTGLLERDVLRQLGEAANVRYVAKLNLGNFQQETSGRAKIFGVRFLDTRTASIRVHLEIWDTQTGGIVWQGNEELTFPQEGVRETPVTFQQVARLASNRLVTKVGESGIELLRNRVRPLPSIPPGGHRCRSAAAASNRLPRDSSRPRGCRHPRSAEIAAREAQLQRLEHALELIEIGLGVLGPEAHAVPWL